MILIVEGRQNQQHADLLQSMFVARKEVFHDRMGWNVSIIDGEERDLYDDLGPLYVFSVDADKRVAFGSLRLLPTTGRTMLKDIFADFFDERVDVSSPLIWECTRFCTHPASIGQLSNHGINNISRELLIGICEAALKAGIAQIVGVFDERMVRIYKRGGWIPDVIARSKGVGHGRVAVGLWDVSESVLEEMRSKTQSQESLWLQKSVFKAAA